MGRLDRWVYIAESYDVERNRWRKNLEINAPRRCPLHKCRPFSYKTLSDVNSYLQKTTMTQPQPCLLRVGENIKRYRCFPLLDDQVQLLLVLY